LITSNPVPGTATPLPSLAGYAPDGFAIRVLTPTTNQGDEGKRTMSTQPFTTARSPSGYAGEGIAASARRDHRVPKIVPGALSFLAQQRLVAVSIAGDDGQRGRRYCQCGEPGFVHAPTVSAT
jgi:hypothetical protein